MKILAAIALLPLALGPLSDGKMAQEERTLTLELCLGGEITIALGDKDEEHNEGGCHQSACHAGQTREKQKRGQLVSG